MVSESLNVVAVFNSNSDAIELVVSALSAAGFSVVWALIPQLRSGAIDFDQFLRQHDPRVVVYDIGPPYEEHWAILQEARRTPALEHRPIVLTSLNAGQAETLAGGDTRVYEIVGKPYDLAQIVQAVKEASRMRLVRRSNPVRRVSGERRALEDRRQPEWTANEVLRRLRDKQVEMNRRHGARRADEPPKDDGPGSDAR